jgi:predicted transcriptional regulator
MAGSNMWQSKGHRSNIEIVADILRLLRLGHASKIEISHISRINGDQASKYLEKLVEAGVLENAQDKMGLPAYQITKKGLSLLSVIKNLQELLPVEGTIDILHKSKITEINIGRILATRGILVKAREDREFAAFLARSLSRYRKGDWGEMSSEDKRLNDLSEENARLLLSSYESPGLPEIWISTSPNREFTTIMFPDEYASAEPLEPYSVLESYESIE